MGRPFFNTPPTGLRSQITRPMVAEDRPQDNEQSVEELTPQQKAARTRARNKAEAEAEAENDETSGTSAPGDEDDDSSSDQIGESPNTPADRGERTDNDPTDAEATTSDEE